MGIEMKNRTHTSNVERARTFINLIGAREREILQCKGPLNEINRSAERIEHIKSDVIGSAQRNILRLVISLRSSIRFFMEIALDATTNRSRIHISNGNRFSCVRFDELFFRMQSFFPVVFLPVI